MSDLCSLINKAEVSKCKEPNEFNYIEKSSPVVRRRSKQMCLRCTPEEYKRINRKIKKAGLSQNEYILRMCLDGAVQARSISALDETVIDEIADIRVLCHRMAKFLRMIRNAVESNSIESEKINEWMIMTSKLVEKLADQIQCLEDKLNGNYPT